MEVSICTPPEPGTPRRGTTRGRYSPYHSGTPSLPPSVDGQGASRSGDTAGQVTPGSRVGSTQAGSARSPEWQDQPPGGAALSTFDVVMVDLDETGATGRLNLTRVACPTSDSEQMGDIIQGIEFLENDGYCCFCSGMVQETSGFWIRNGRCAREGTEEGHIRGVVKGVPQVGRHWCAEHIIDIARGEQLTDFRGVPRDKNNFFQVPEGALFNEAYLKRLRTFARLISERDAAGAQLSRYATGWQDLTVKSGAAERAAETVSYTHLTLPTNREV